MKALNGIRVLDFSWLLPGPYATMLLADFGADVIKIEQPGRGDYTREILPDMYQVSNRNKRSMTINLKNDEGRSLAHRLVRDADVVVEGFRPGVMERLGLSYETLSALNPRLVYCSVSGYGQDGPYRDWPGHDIAYLGVGGGLSVSGDLKHPPVKGTISIADLAGAMFAAYSMQGALFERSQSGKGQYLDVSITDCVAAWSGIRLANILWNGEPLPNRLSATSRVFDTADGKRTSLAVTEDPFFVKLCEALNRPEWVTDERFAKLESRRDNARELLPYLEAEMLKKPRAEWLALFQSLDVPAAPVHDPEDVFNDPQLVHRKMTWQGKPDGKAPHRMPAFPVKFRRDGPTLRNVAPEQGADTEAVLLEAGLSGAEIAGLKEHGVI